MMQRPSQGYYADINVTNLVDVVLVLLIIFMITAPMLNSGIEVKLPKTQATSKDLGEGIVVTIDKEGKVYLDEPVADRFGEIIVVYRDGQNGYLKSRNFMPILMGLSRSNPKPVPSFTECNALLSM